MKITEHRKIGNMTFITTRTIVHSGVVTFYTETYSVDGEEVTRDEYNKLKKNNRKWFFF